MLTEFFLVERLMFQLIELVKIVREFHCRNLKLPINFFSDVCLPNEVWFEIVKRLDFIDAIRFSMASKKFYQTVLENKKYKSAM